MAEKLKRIQPTSSIANALNLEAVRAATGPAPARTSAAAAVATYEPQAPIHVESPRPSVVAFVPPSSAAFTQRQAAPEPRGFVSREPTGEPANIVRQLHLTASTDATLQKIIAAYSRAIGFELSKTEFFRAVLRALEPTVELHAREAAGIGRLKRHKNEAWLFHKRDELERTIAKAFTAAMRAAPSME